MRVCLMIEGQEGVGWEEWRALAAACEEQGIEGLFRSDHYLSVEGRAERGSLDAWATLAGLAAVTTELRLGTLVSPATFRHPSQLAKVVTTVDHISGGRVELGMGTGWLREEHEAYGFPFPSQGERMGELEEQLQIVAGEWGAGPINHHGSRYTLVALDALPKPVQQPRPPLLLGGRGGPRSLELGARYADEYNTVHKTVDEIATIRRGLDEACERAGREPMPLSQMAGVLIGADRADLRDRAAQFGELRGIDGDADAVLAGMSDDWIVGTVDEAAEQLAALQAAGLERVMLQHLLHRDLDAIALFARVRDAVSG
jgi:alkanesulfonate monooxygenase SsuD/methylene tetrahydromethanopterin reductase-like flavin-dependent oxidoreductase (luciferase family)